MRAIDADELLEILQAWRDEAERLDAPVNYKFASAIITQVERMPTIEPERKRGEWNRYYRMHSGDTFVCNRCGSCFVVLQGEDKMNFCPNCGADMIGELE